MRLTREILRSQASTFLLLYRASGLRATLSSIQSVCSEFTEVDRINVMCVPSDLSCVINVADTATAYRLPLVPRREGKAPPFVLWDRWREKMIIDDLDPYRKRVDYGSPDLANIPMLEQHSLCRIPVEGDSDFVFLFNFWSKKYSQFIQDDLDDFETLIMPLALELESLYRGGLAVLPHVTLPSSGFERLFLCPDLSEVRSLVEKVAKFPVTVLIQGETGCGKEAVADGIRECSTRKDAPFIKVNCGAIAATLLESELFGHERGSFTGAVGTRRGFFEAANGGTILLDEIGEMSLEAQTRLLRVLENKTVTRIGSTEDIPIDVRVVASTNVDLEEKIRLGKFRKDLWFRLSSFPILVPPLRERKNDIPVLVHYFIQKKNKEFATTVPEKILESEMENLMKYRWPGNVRELEHVVERSIIMWPGSGHIHFNLPPSPQEKMDIGNDWPDLSTLEARYIRKAVDHCGGKLSGPGGAAELLGIHYTTLHAKLSKI